MIQQVETRSPSEKFAKSAYWYFLVWGICSSLSMTLSTLVDAILVGNLVGSDGLAITSIATPVFLFYALLGMTIGVGGSVKIGRALGSSNLKEANRIFHRQLLAGLAIGLVCMAVFLLLRDELCIFLGAEEDLLPLARQYLTVVLYAAPVFVLYHILGAAVRTDSDPKQAAVASAVVIVVNLTLDLVFMQGMGLGIVGASASLCIGEFLGLLTLLLHFGKKRSLLRLRLSLPRLSDLRDFVVNGFGVGSSYIFQAIVMFTFNILLLTGPNGVTHVAIFSVLYTLSTLPAAVYEGASNAVSTVVSIFAGERDSHSMLVTLRQGLLTVGIVGVAMAGAFVLWAEQLVRFFGITDGAAVAEAARAVRIFSISVVFMGVNVLYTSFWQTIGRAKLASVMSVVRNFAFMMVLGAVLISRFQIVGLCLTYVGSEALCLLGVGIVRLVRSSDGYVQNKYSTKGRAFEKLYPIGAEGIGEIARDLEQLVEEWEIPYKKAFFINLIVEELILNIHKFGLRDTKRQRHIAIKLMENGEEYILRIRDNVRTYNPFDSGEDGDDIDNAALTLITKKAQFYNYQRKLIFNYLYLIL